MAEHRIHRIAMSPAAFSGRNLVLLAFVAPLRGADGAAPSLPG